MFFRADVTNCCVALVQQYDADEAYFATVEQKLVDNCDLLD